METECRNVYNRNDKQKIITKAIYKLNNIHTYTCEKKKKKTREAIRKQMCANYALLFHCLTWTFFMPQTFKKIYAYSRLKGIIECHKIYFRLNKLQQKIKNITKLFQFLGKNP